VAPLVPAIQIEVNHRDEGSHCLQATRRVLSARRIVLLATISGLAAGAALAGSGVQVQLPKFSSVQAAENTQRMPGFADVVDKVKPAVISVRVKVDGAKMMSFDGNSPFPPNSPMERFFRRFGMPFGDDAPDSQRQPHDHPMTGQGSGFFITSDGYAVTNNHVVDKAKTVEIITDDGKTTVPRW
jgi:serine protease Do